MGVLISITRTIQLCNVNTFAVCFRHSFFFLRSFHLLLFTSFIEIVFTSFIEIAGWKSGMLHHVCNTYVFNSMVFSMNINSRRGLFFIHSPKTTIIFGDDRINCAVCVAWRFFNRSSVVARFEIRFGRMNNKNLRL